MKAELNKTYNFDYTGSVSPFGLLDLEETYEVFRDGRVSCHFLERDIAKIFPELTWVNKTGYDHIDKSGQKYDAKNFTKNGFRFMPSNQIGEGRAFDQEKSHAHAKDLIYICCDIVEFPRVRMIFKTGSGLTQEYPLCHISQSKREVLFG